jgi:hypothetical protein
VQLRVGGEFVFRPPPPSTGPSRLLFIVGGVGINSLYGMLREIVSGGSENGSNRRTAKQARGSGVHLNPLSTPTDPLAPGELILNPLNLLHQRTLNTYQPNTCFCQAPKRCSSTPRPRDRGWSSRRS